MDARWKHPFTCIVAGPTGCGKSTFVMLMLRHAAAMIDPPPEKITWCYSEWQSTYATMDLMDVDTVPKTMQAKARRLMEHLKRDIAWTARGELIHDGMTVAGSNMVDLVNDLLRKRKTDPTGWQPFARQLRAINLPMELIGNVARRAYIWQATTVTPSRRRAPATPRAGAGSVRTSLS